MSGLNRSLGLVMYRSSYVMIIEGNIKKTSMVIGKHSTKGIGSLLLAKDILKGVKDNENYLYDSLITKQSENNDKFLRTIIKFLKDMEWISEDRKGKFKITQEGLKNKLDNLIF